LEVTIQLEPTGKQLELFGPADSHLRLLRKSLDVQITARQSNLIITGKSENVNRAAEIIDKMEKHLIKYGSLANDDVNALLAAKDELAATPETSEALTVYSHKKVIEPTTKGQLKYVETMLANDLTFCIGPAGTGKTYLAVAVAVSMLRKKQIRKIILARPAVEAGEKLGFLPGDLYQKINPYLRPLYDALFDLTRTDQANRLIERGIIEIAPLGFMRGRTLNDSFIILDEAQNTTREQMKMLLTRAGFGSKVVVTADITQIDLPQPKKSGVLEAIRILSSIPEIAFIRFNERDVVRHPLVQKIIKAYDRADSKASKVS
jgi:phosphate starvation-inducible PhoH-like protein